MDLFRTEFHIKLLWGSGSGVADFPKNFESRHCKFAKVVTALSAICTKWFKRDGIKFCHEKSFLLDFKSEFSSKIYFKTHLEKLGDWNKIKSLKLLWFIKIAAFHIAIKSFSKFRKLLELLFLDFLMIWFNSNYLHHPMVKGNSSMWICKGYSRCNKLKVESKFQSKSPGGLPKSGLLPSHSSWLIPYKATLLYV